MSGRTDWIATATSDGRRSRSAGGGTGIEQGASALSPRVTQPREGKPVPVLSPHEAQTVGLADDWPLRSYVELGALASAVPCARSRTRQVLWEWGLTELSESAELLVTELMTNAVKASQSLPGLASIRLWLVSDKQRIVIFVWDANPQPPVRVDAEETAESGRGLLLVEAISDRWDWYIPNSWGGKIVWCEVSADESRGESRQFLTEDF
jgi:anti-sigma regulatory factor (Ser/Thr protein kinase)